MRVETKDLDRKYEPCPYRCRLCRLRAEIVFDIPEGCKLIELPPAARPSF